MKRIIISLCIMLISITVFAEKKEYENPMSTYHENYFIIGDEDDQTKFQVSVKYALLFPSKIGFYVGYTQRSLWKTYDKSSPFAETNYMPEMFYRFESKQNIFDWNLGIIDYIQVSPIFHKSNGRDGLDSRGINTYYGQIQVSYGEVYNIGINIKGFNYYTKSKKNSDIEDYQGYYEADVFFKLKSKSVQYLDKEEFHVKFGSGKDKGWVCGEMSFRILTTYVQPKLFIQVYHGYGEWIIDYNKKDTTIRAGLVF